VAYYTALDLRQGLFPIDPADAEEFSASTYLRRFGPAIPPMLIVKAGRDATPGINESIDRFVAEAARAHADVRELTHATAPHAFDVSARTARSKAVVRETLRFLKARLAKPLRMRDGCGTAAERASAVRFFAADDTRLIGIGLGSGPRGVVLAHENRASLCNWLPYARQLAAAGYRVLAYDSRNSGSSGNSPRSSLDLDVVAAAEALRRSGAQRVVLGGASIGATAALVGAAALADPPAGVYSLSGPFSSGPLHGGSAVGRLRVPLLLAAAEADGGFADDARNLYAASVSADRTLTIAPGGAHGTQMLEDPSFRASVTGFIARALGS
jgi:dienelactone hydrolase